MAKVKEIYPDELHPHELRLRELVHRSGLHEALQPAAFKALEFYVDYLPYHNPEHILEVAERVLDLCQQREIDAHDQQILFLAALWHDASYHEPLEAEYKSKEHRSAALAFDAITQASLFTNPDETRVVAQQVAELVLATNSELGPGGELGELLNIADLANLNEGGVTMLRETGALFAEKLLLDGQISITNTSQVIMQHQQQLEQWITGARNYVTKLVKDKLDPASDVYRTSLSNIQDMTVGKLLRTFKIKDQED